MSDGMIRVCIHCGNAVEEINYGEKNKYITRGELENQFKHSKPRPYPVCSTSPLMSDDTEFVNGADYEGPREE